MEPACFPGQQATRVFNPNALQKQTQRMMATTGQHTMAGTWSTSRAAATAPAQARTQACSQQDRPDRPDRGLMPAPVQAPAYNPYLDRGLPVPKTLPLPTMPRSEGHNPDVSHYWREKGITGSTAHWQNFEDTWAKHMARSQRPARDSEPINPQHYPSAVRAHIPKHAPRPFSYSGQHLADKDFQVLPYHGMYTFEHLNENASISRGPRSGDNRSVPNYSRTLKPPVVEGPIMRFLGTGVIMR